jgi:hypothetical protein
MSGDASSAPEVESLSVEVLRQIADRNQTWSVMAAKYGVDNPLPPWKTSLDGMCDALDRSCAGTDSAPPLTFKQRRDEEDALSAGSYTDLPYPENQLVALAHSLLARGIIAEDELRDRLEEIRTRLEAE